jgi:predicted HicB family RNase H-like nuclease
MAQDADRAIGRPKNPEPGGTVCTWLPASDHDRIVAQARAERVSVSALVREALRVSLLKNARVE